MKENNNEKYEITLPAGDHTSKGGQASRSFTTISTTTSNSYTQSLLNQLSLTYMKAKSLFHEHVRCF